MLKTRTGGKGMGKGTVYMVHGRGRRGEGYARPNGGICDIMVGRVTCERGYALTKRKDGRKDVMKE